MTSKRVITVVLLVLFHGLAWCQESTPEIRTLKRIPSNSKLGIILQSPPITEGYTRPSRPLTPAEISEINKPATVQVVSTYHFTVAYPIPGTFMILLLKFEADNAARAGRIEDNGAARLEYILNRISENPARYISPTSQLATINFNPTSTGSGAFITPQGHVVTNAHVIEISRETFQTMGAQQILQGIVEKEIGSLIDTYQAKPNEATLQECANNIYAYYGQFLKLTHENVEYSIKTGKTMEDPKYQLPAELLTYGSAIPGKDVAILKVNGSNFPTIAFGDDRILKTGEKLYVMGYPGTIENNEVLTQDMKEPSFTEGMMNARQTTAQGWTAIQLDAATYRGNSGGPVFNQYGEVVGLLTFGSFNEDKSALIQGFNFVVPSHIVGEFTRAAKIQPALGVAMNLYREALQIREKDSEKSSELMQQVKTYNQDWPYFNNTLVYSVGKAQPWYMQVWNQFKWYHYTGIVIALLYLVYWILKKVFN